MDLGITAALIGSTVLVLLTYLATKSELLAFISFAVAPLLSLSFWIGKVTIGIGPEPFIPNWMAGAMVLFPFIAWFFLRPEIKKERDE